MSSKYTIRNQEEIDPDLGVKIILRSDSPFWKVQYNSPGKGQQRHSLKTKSKKQAKLNAYKLARKLATGEMTNNPGKKYTIGEVSEARCQRLRDLGRSQATVNDFSRRVRQLGVFLPRGLDTPIENLSLATLEAFEHELRTNGIDTPPPPGSNRKGSRGKPQEPKTVLDAMKTIRSMMKFARERGWLRCDPAAGYTFPPKDEKPIVVFSADELALLFDDPEEQMGEVWRFYTETCLRANELTWLLKADVIIDEQCGPAAIHIRNKSCPQTGARWKPKHGKERVVALTPRASAILTRAMAASETPWAFAPPTTNPKQPGKWVYKQLLDRLKARLALVGIDPCGLHRLRHTGATYLANDARMPIAQLQKFLGHAAIKETQRYLHPRAEHIAESIRSIDFDRLINLRVASNNAQDK